LVLGDRRWARHRGGSEGGTEEARNGSRAGDCSHYSHSQTTIHESEEVGWGEGGGEEAELELEAELIG
jgi:hypothetical protein